MTIAVMTFGCKVNQYDTQVMLEGFLAMGYELGSADDVCDVYLVNTCTVTSTGEQKSLKAIRQVAKRNPQAAIVVAGCLSQRVGEELLLMDGVRLVVGTKRRTETAALLTQVLKDGSILCAVEDLEKITYEEEAVTAHDGFARAVMKIQEGCNNHCAYCIIPTVRGSIRSRSLFTIARQAKRLAEQGYLEIVVTGIHLSSYGKDLPEKSTLLDAIRTICDQPDIHRVRLGSLEPSFITKEIAYAFASMEPLCHQFHVSLQSGSDTILRSMRRTYTTKDYQAAIGFLREAMPGCAITTDIITGFPGETEEDFLQTLSFAEDMQFAHIHVFPYSKREGTPAADFQGQLPIAICKERANRLLVVAKELEEAYVLSQVGKVGEVLLISKGSGINREHIQVEAPGGERGQVAKVAQTHCIGTKIIGNIL